MDIALLNQAHKESMEHLISFPTYIEKMILAGVERITYDFVQMNKTSYSLQQEFYIQPLELPMSKLGEYFDLSLIKQGILLSQKENLPFVDFAQNIIQAGCVGYHIFITGKHVLYYGTKGDIHQEYFPQS